MRILNCLSLILVIIGAINWGLWGFFQFDLVAWVTGGNTNGLARMIYSLVGLGGVWRLGYLAKCREACNQGDHRKGPGSNCCK